MRAGDLDRRITLERRVLSGGNPFNEALVTFSPIAEVWAQVRPQGGTEFLGAQAVTAEQRVVFRLRWRDDLTASDRILYEGLAYNIVGFKELGRREGLEILAVASDGG